jgi:hypothetical protein
LKLKSRFGAWALPLAAALMLLLSACAKSGGGSATPIETAAPSTITATATRGATVTATVPRPAASVAATPAVAQTPLSQQQLDRMALSSTDLPPGFGVTASGPGGQELGPDVLASFQEEFQQRDVTSGAALQQTIVIINLVGQYRDSAAAASGVKALTAQNLNQLLNSVNLSAEAATVPAIGEDTQGFHFTGDTNGVGVGGYLIAFHRGPIAGMVLTASVKGAEALPQIIDLAQKQAQKIPPA